VNVKDNITRSEVRFVDPKTTRQDGTEEDSPSMNNDINFDAMNSVNLSIPPTDA
jgi:hypothetical protein